MSISTGPVGASSGLQHSQKTAQLAVAGKDASGAAFKPTAGIANADLSGAPAVKRAADAKDGDVVKPSALHVQQSLDDINKVMATLSISVQFKIDPDYKELIINVVDEDTGKLIRQIPTEEVVKMSKAMDNLKGLLFAQSV
ncbi:flagellar protein FlaG [Polaromonas sp. CG_9.11]|uniref:flagellar protein FlaG n=1 Tax=Polaromonas sp. CG_9.11 TaxID=2787730 RepID=UPI0018CAFE97|nr:flagellar protein FlaG [Polaromonas sp. CG_9.11]MBG6077615.1 flagellar protein FlaG [Polaromonas sp. CG_9.11]